MGRALFFLLLSAVAIGLEWYVRRDLRKSLIALATLLLLAAWAVLGLTMRPVIPIFLAHLFLLAIAWAALMLYLWKGRYHWWLYWLPALTPIFFVILNFLEGSRYE